MALNFPSNPSLNDTYSYNGKTWVFNGSAWIQTRTETVDITTSGNVTANSFIGDGSQLTGLPAGYTDSNVETVLSGNIIVGNISVTGAIDGYATTTYVDSEVANLVASAPATLDTLNELASALNDDANFATTVTNLIGNNSANITTLQGNITSIESDISNLEANISANLQSNVTALESDVSTLQGNIISLDNQVANLNYYDDTNVTTFLSDIGSNAITTTGNVTADYFIGNGSQLTGINVSGGSVTTSNAAPSSPNDGDVWFDTESGKQFTYINDGDSSQWVETQAHTSLSLGGGDIDLSAVDQNVVPSANITYDLGSETNRWRDIYLANSTIYLGEANISAQGGALTLPSTVSIGNSVLDASSGNLALPSTVSIGSVTLDASSGNLALPANSSIGGASVSTPRIVSIDYGDDDTAANIAGGQTIGIVGSGFSSGAQVLLDGSSIGVVTVVNSGRIEITAPAKSTGSYTLYVINSDGATGIYIPGVQYSGVPSWSSPSAGSLGSIYETETVSNTFVANSDSTVSYSLYSGNLPEGTTLDANTGVLTGNANLIVGSSVTYNFTIRATDEENQDTDRSFSLTVNADEVTWSSPTDGATVSLIVDQSNTTTLSASSAVGDNISYTANTLPNGLSVSGATITGTPTTIANTSVELTATANTTTRSSTIVVTFAVTLPLGDEYFNQTTLLLNGDTNTFITDASDNAFTITPVADTRPSAFSPYNTSWSHNFDNATTLTTGPSSEFAFGTDDFTVEMWIYATTGNSFTTEDGFFQISGTAGGIASSYGGGVVLALTNPGVYFIVDGTVQSFGSLLSLNRWYHIACSRENGNVRCFIDGSLVGTYTQTGNITGTYMAIGGYATSSYLFGGNISNVRVVKGTALYTASFVPSTSPLTAVPGTSLLTCQSSRLIDNSPNAFTITKNGSTGISTLSPFAETDTTTGSGYFDGTGDYLTVNSFNGSLGSGDYTIEFWFNTSDSNGYEFFAPTTSLEGPAIIGTSGTNLIFQSNYGNSTGFTWSGAAIVHDNCWHHLALTRNGTSVKMYVDGILRGQRTESPVIDYSGYTTNWTLGYGNQGAGRIYTGYLSNFRVVTGTAVYTGGTNTGDVVFTPPTSPLTAVSGTQLLTLQNRIGYNNSQPIDESGIKNIITRNGNASAGSFSPHVLTGWSAYFDGTTDYLAVDQGAINLENWYSEDYSIEMWVKPTVHAQSGVNATGLYIVHGVYNTNTAYWSLGTTSTGLLRWLYYNGAVVSLTATDNALSLNVWSHVALVYTHSTGAIKGYVNGVEVFSGTKVGTPQSTNTNDINIGVSQGTYYTGYISNLRIVKGTAIYTSTFTPPTEPLEPIEGTSLLTLRGPAFAADGPNRFAITRNGDTKILPFSPFRPHTVAPDSYSVYFDGNGDSIYNVDGAGTNFGTGDFTMEVWIYPMSSSTSQVFLDTSKTSTYSTAIGLAYKGATGQISLFYNGSSDYRLSTATLSLNQWYHVAFVRESNALRIFIDGVESTWTQGATNLTSNFNLNNIYIGRWGGNSSYPFLGYISNARVVKGTAVYTSNFTPSTSPLTAITGTSVLACQSSTVIDNSGNNVSLTTEGNAQPTKFNPFGETVTTGVEYSPANHGGSMYFDGTGDYLTIPSSSGVAFGTNPYTVECWFYHSAPLSSYNTIYSVASGLKITLMSDGAIRIWNTSGTSSSSAASLVQPFRWHHIAFVRESTSLAKVYLDGNPVITVTTGEIVTTNFTDQISYVGYFADGFNHFFQGYISNLRVIKGTALYTSAFVPPQAPLTPIPGTTLLLNGTNAAIQDKTGRNVIETLGNTQVLNGIRKYGSGAMFFDGTGDYARAAPSDLFNVLGTEFTLEAWIYATDLVSAGPFSILGKYGNWYWIVYGSTNAGLFRMIGSGGAVVVSATGVQSGIQQDTWHHVAFTRDGSNIPRLFVDGNLVATGAAYTASFDNTMRLGIGTYQGDSAGYTWKGYIDDLRITKGVARYTSNFTPPTSTYTLK